MSGILKFPVKNLFSGGDAEPAGEAPPGRVFMIAAAILFALGAAMRVFGAWAFEFSHTSDHGIICLMVKHMLEGLEFPVFFYGLPYMGSIEPATSAVLCRIFGMSGFWINMGTALWGIALLPVVYYWGRAAGGRVAGLAALAFCVVGPPDYFQFLSWADGGYAAILFFTSLILFMAARMAEMESAGRRCEHWRFLLLGVVAGLGWWQSPLLIPSFMTSALLLLAAMRRRVFTARIFTGLAGFIAGSAPLWHWNFHNRWQTFDMMNMRDRPEFWHGLKLFYFKRIPDLLQFHIQAPAVRVALAATLIILLAIAAVYLLVAIARRQSRQAQYIAAALLFIAIYSVLYGRSRFAGVNAPRYVLVLIPTLAVLLGTATARLARAVPFGLHWLPLAALVAIHVVRAGGPLRNRSESVQFLPKAAALADFMRTNSIRRAYTEYQPPRENRVNHAMNFLLKEEFVFSPYRRERYRPYALEMELSRDVAVMNNWHDFQSFLLASGGSADTGSPAGMTVHFNARPPGGAWTVLPAADMAKITDGAGNSLAGLVLDGSLETDWMNVAGQNAAAEVVADFKEPVTMAGLRLLHADGAYPGTVAVDAWDAAGNKWVEAAPSVANSGYFWSGPRFYWGGSDFRLERRFAPVLTSRMRIRLANNRKGVPFRMRELQVFTAGGHDGTVPDDAALKGMIAGLADGKIKSVYADRWEANEIYAACSNTMRVSCQRGIGGQSWLPPAVDARQGTAMLVHEREAELTRRTLRDAGIAAAETNIAPWILFEFTSDRQINDLPLAWCGFGCLRGKTPPAQNANPPEE